MSRSINEQAQFCRIDPNRWKIKNTQPSPRRNQSQICSLFHTRRQSHCASSLLASSFLWVKNKSEDLRKTFHLIKTTPIVAYALFRHIHMKSMHQPSIGPLLEQTTFGNHCLARNVQKYPSLFKPNHGCSTKEIHGWQDLDAMPNPGIRQFKCLPSYDGFTSKQNEKISITSHRSTPLHQIVTLIQLW